LSAEAFFANASRAWPSLSLLCALSGFVSGCSAKETAAADPPSARCAGCHLQEYQATSQPPHAGVRPTTCGVCHGEVGWHPSRSVLVHSFPLQGGHAKAACFDCHRGPTPTFEGTTKQCFDCHQKEQASANAQVERHASFPSQCDTCHTTTAWKPTLPHDDVFADAPDNHAPRSPSPGTPSAVDSAAKPRPAKKASSGMAVGPNNAPGPPSKPDQISGASWVKKR
jgi:hypothetical protein